MIGRKGDGQMEYGKGENTRDNTCPDIGRYIGRAERAGVKRWLNGFR